MVLSTLGFVSVPTDKILKDCSQTNVGAVPRKMFADVYRYEDPPPSRFGVDNSLLTFVQAF
jgi:hypothetical protein